MAIEDQILKEMFPASEMPKKEPEQVDPAVREAYPASPEIFAGASPAEPADPAAQAFRAEVARWESQVRADPEIGGPRFEQAIASARGLVSKYGDADLRAALNASGLGSHPSVIKLLARIAGEMQRAK